MTKRQKITAGAILEINIDNQYYVYAQILEKGGFAFLILSLMIICKT